MEVSIVTLGHVGHEKLGKFKVCVDVVHTSCVDEVIEQRRHEGFHVNPRWSPSNGVSIGIRTDAMGCLEMTLDVSGALKPEAALIDGQNVLKFDGKTELKRIISLIRNPCDSSGRCSISFSSNNSVIHEMVIKGIGSPSTISLTSLDHVDPMELSGFDVNNRLSLPGQCRMNESTLSLTSFDQIPPMDSSINDVSPVSSNLLSVTPMGVFSSNPSTVSLKSYDEVPAMDDTTEGNTDAADDDDASAVDRLVTKL